MSVDLDVGASEVERGSRDEIRGIIEKNMETIIISMFAILFTVAIIIVRFRLQKTKDVQVGQFYVPELPYSPPARSPLEMGSPYHRVLTESLLQPRVISTIMESEEYEDIELSS